MPRFADKPLLLALAGTEILAGTSIAGGGADPTGSVAPGADIKITIEQLRDWILATPPPDVVTALVNTAGTITVDCSLGKSFTITLAANVATLTLTNLAGVGFATEIEIEIKQDATGGRTFALPAAFKALGGSDTAIASAANAVTVLSAKTFDNGTTWRYAMQESA